MKWQIILIVVLWTLGGLWLSTDGVALAAFQLAMLGWVGGLMIHRMVRTPGEVWRPGPRRIPEMALKFIAGLAATVVGVSTFVGVFGPGVWMSPAEVADQLRLTGGLSGDAAAFAAFAVGAWDLGLAAVGAAVVLMIVAMVGLAGRTLLRRLRRQPLNAAAMRDAPSEARHPPGD